MKKKSYKTLLWGLDQKGTAIGVKEIEKDSAIEIIEWYGDFKNGSHVTRDYLQLMKGNIPIDKNISTIKNLNTDIITKNHAQILEMMSRSSVNLTSSPFDLIDLSFRFFHYFSAIIKSNNINLIIFNNIPHEAPSFILYLLAYYSNLKIIIFCQLPFSNLHLAFNAIDHYGSLDKAYHNESLCIPNISLQPTLFYMKPVKLNLFSKLYSKVKNSYRCIFLYGLLLRLLCYKNKSHSLLTKAHLLQQFDSDFNSTISKDFKLDKLNFVYFALHLQPEMTTSALGDDYCDQLLAIEKLREIIPDDWHIVVKENPKQGFYRRGHHFFKRLKEIKNIIYLSTYDSLELITRSRFVATISGTVGWEAICNNKKVLIFGHTWYKNFPGVIFYNETVTVSQLLEDTNLHADILKCFDKFIKKTHLGVIDPAYEQIVSNYNDTQNNLNVSNSLRKILEVIQ